MTPPILLIDLWGPLCVYSSRKAAEQYLEGIDKEKWKTFSFIGFDAEGRRIEVVVLGHYINLLYWEIEPSHQEVAAKMFRVFLSDLAEERGWEALGVTPEWVEGANLHDLAQFSMKFVTA